MDETPRWKTIALTVIALPIVVGVMVPLAVLFAIVLYALGLLGAFRNLGAYLFARKQTPPPVHQDALPAPHFLQARIRSKDPG